MNLGMNFLLRNRLHTAGIAWAVVALALGCGSSDKGKVTGTVTFEGRPVPGGSISFVPVVDLANAGAGRVATGAVRGNGSFALSTDADEDGALLGLHEVVYAPPAVGGESADPALAKSPYDGLVPREPQVEVKSGENSFAIELIKPKPAP